MKTIILPTDFSPVADHAINFGAQLAQAIQADILLLSVYMVPVTMNEVPVTMVSAEELKNNAEEGLRRVQLSLQQSFPDVPIKTESRLGDVVDELKNICKEVNPFAVVMGTHHLSGVEQALFGSNTISAIRHIHSPIIAVATQTAFQFPKNIALATDFENLAKFPTERITSFVQTFNANLHVVHVTENAAEEDTTIATQLRNKLSLLQPSYYLIKDDNIEHGLQQYIQQQQIDWLLLVPHDYNFLQRLFSKTHVKSILDHISIPVVSIAES